jgi:hypothetical protein
MWIIQNIAFLLWDLDLVPLFGEIKRDGVTLSSASPDLHSSVSVYLLYNISVAYPPSLCITRPVLMCTGSCDRFRPPYICGAGSLGTDLFPSP